MAIEAAPAFLDTTHLLNTFGLIGLLLIIFAETGLLVGFFLPGDSLLFTAGLVSAGGLAGVTLAPLWVLLILLPLVAIAGNLVGYWIGYRAGPAVFNRPNSRLFKACWPASCRSSAPSPPSWPAPRGWTSGCTRSTR
jgi:membrane-associated protein